MKVKKLLSKLYLAVLAKDSAAEKKIWKKLLKKSLKHKRTFNVSQ